MTAWETLSKPELITQLMITSRQLARVREEARQAKLKIELLTLAQRS